MGGPPRSAGARGEGGRQPSAGRGVGSSPSRRFPPPPRSAGQTPGRSHGRRRRGTPRSRPGRSRTARRRTARLASRPTRGSREDPRGDTVPDGQPAVREVWTAVGRRVVIPLHSEFPTLK
ncbi:hypothetical protein DIZ27_27410 [Streptomyces sp. NWU339]|nr:hypothetical protein DIZ27_27410 [Streptomyces sp. NWU339]